MVLMNSLLYQAGFISCGIYHDLLPGYNGLYMITLNDVINPLIYEFWGDVVNNGW